MPGVHRRHGGPELSRGAEESSLPARHRGDCRGSGRASGLSGRAVPDGNRRKLDRDIWEVSQTIQPERLAFA